MKIKTITVSSKDAVAYMENTNALFKALWELTDLLRLESELKKHHRAYLHVRENIDEKVKEARTLMNKVSMDTLKSNINHNASDDAPNCKDCVCCDCDEDCSGCAFSPCYEEEETDCDEDYPFEEARAGEDDETEDENAITLTKQKYNDMVEDLLTMAELIDMVCDMRTYDEGEIRKLARFVPAFAAYERNRLRVYREAAKEAESIMDRWDGEYDPDYEPDEYYSD